MNEATTSESYAEEEKRKKGAMFKYELIVPISMRETDLMLLPAIKPYLDWQPDDTGKGLTIMGSTGKGKTRLTYLIFKNLLIEKGLDVIYFRPGEFVLQTGAAWMNNTIESLHSNLAKADLVIFDDLGKEKFTETRCMDFFTTVNNRMDNKKPIIFTTNYTGNELAARFVDKDFAEPFVRRIREATETINLK